MRAIVPPWNVSLDSRLLGYQTGRGGQSLPWERPATEACKAYVSVRPGQGKTRCVPRAVNRSKYRQGGPSRHSNAQHRRAIPGAKMRRLPLQGLDPDPAWGAKLEPPVPDRRCAGFEHHRRHPAAPRLARFALQGHPIVLRRDPRAAEAGHEALPGLKARQHAARPGRPRQALRA